jgi:hypothetical protein
MAMDIAAASTEIASLQGAKDHHSRMADKVSVVGDGPNLLQQAALEAVRQISVELQKQRFKKSIMEQAAALMEGYTFKEDAPVEHFATSSAGVSLMYRLSRKFPTDAFEHTTA